MPLIAEAVYVDPPAPGLGRRLMLATIAAMERRKSIACEASE